MDLVCIFQGEIYASSYDCNAQFSYKYIFICKDIYNIYVCDMKTMADTHIFMEKYFLSRDMVQWIKLFLRKYET